MNRRRFCLFALAMLLLVCASSCDSCNSAKLSTKDVPAAGLWTNYKYKSDADVFSCFPFSCFGFPDLKGGGTFQPDEGTIMVGFNSQVKGNELCGCEVWSSDVNRGDVMFEVSKFKNIVTASLLFDEGESLSVEGDTVGNSADSIGAIHLGTLTGYSPGTQALQVADFPAVGDPYVAPFPKADEIKNQKTPFPISIKKDGKTFDVDVTALVKQWLSGERPNTGFVFIGRDESWPEEVNRANITTYKNFRLRIVFNPALNPGVQ